MKKIVLLLLSLVLFVSCANRDEQSSKSSDSKENKSSSSEAVLEAKEKLEEETSLFNQSLPQQVDEITTCVSCKFDGKDVIYEYVVDESYATISQLKNNKDVLRSNLKSIWDEYPAMKEMKKRLQTVGGKVVYKYSGSDTGEKMVINIEI